MLLRRIPTKAENPGGLHQRYVVTRADGTPPDPRARYFVLRLDNAGSDANHIAACRAAARAYAAHVQASEVTHLQGVANGLLDLVEHLEQDPA